jgi:DNA-binding NarL/FixJ family response regulator
MTVRVAIVDDQAMVRAGFRSLLDDEPDIEVVGEAPDGEAAVALVRRERPDVALMDIRMPVLDGIEATRRLARGGSATRILALTTFNLDEYVFNALRAGAGGFMLKDAPAEELIAAIHVLARGESLIAPAVARRVIEEFARLPPPADTAPPAALEELTPREIEVLELLARGLSNAEIAAALVVGDATVKTHVARVLMKLGLRDRIQAVVFAYESGLVRPGERRA